MEQEKKDLTPADATAVAKDRGTGRRLSTAAWILIVCFAVAASVLLTYTLTAAAQRKNYTEQLLAQQATINELSASRVDENLSVLDSVIRQYSYYAGTLSEKQMLEAAFKAYVAASGDRYATYYTAEEYAELLEQSLGELCGIGVSVKQTTVSVEGNSRLAFEITGFHVENAFSRGLRKGDLIVALHHEGQWKTVDSEGYDRFVSLIRGEEGTDISLQVLRGANEACDMLEFTVTRVKFETLTVRGSLYEKDPRIGIVQISSFDFKTPEHFKRAVSELLRNGAEYFVFDVRDNPGGDLKSIMAVLSYFLSPGDLVLSAIDREGNVAESHTVQAVTYAGNYASCSVSASEIGMYRELPMVVLCNEKTASAAEVFTATMRDYGLARTVGQKTFGKGIMQTTRRIVIGDAVGYIKLTTHAYVTQCGVSYHDIGITPDVGVLLGEEAQKYAIVNLPQALDAQLQTAVAVLLSQ